MTDVYAAALAYLRAGWTPTPVVSKVPVLQDWPTRTVSEADAYSFWGEGTYTGIGIVCGAPSGNLLVVDIEGRLAGDQQRLAAIWAKAAELGVDQILGAAMSGACATTPSGGRHIFLRCTDGPVPGNVKLCYRLEDDGRTTSLLAETRGAGGQVAAWPAPGREWLGTSGPGSAMPVTSVQLGLVLDAFRWIDEAQRLPAPTSRPRSSTFEAPRSLTVAQALNDSLMADEMSWLDVLDPGWTHTGYDRSGRSMWLRPDYGDKSTALNSAHGLEKFEGGPTPVLVVHSNSVRHLPTGDGQRLTPGRVMAYCWFEGNEAAAYAALETAVKGGEVHPAVARLPRPTLERVVEVVTSKLPKPPEAPALAPAPSPSAVQSQPAPAGEGPAEGDGTSVSRTTWYAVDLSAALAGVWSDPPPVALRRADGVAMFYRGKVNGLLGESESGKAQPYSAMVQTPSGPRRMGDLRVGEVILGLDGAAQQVLEIHEQGDLEVWEVETSDGVVVECCGDHLWSVQDANDRGRAGGRYRTLRTADLAGQVRWPRGNPRYSLPLSQPARYARAQQPIDPYLLGLLLGDGGMTKGVSFTCGDEELHERVRDLLPEGVTAKRDGITAYLTVTRGGDARNPLIDHLRELGLYGHLSVEKFIPEDYLRGDVEQRTLLLRGLMDTDGYLLHGRTAEYSTSSPRLAADVCELVRSLGGTAEPHWKVPVYQGGEGRPACRIIVRLPLDQAPFTLPRKRDAYAAHATRRGPNRSIVRVERTGRSLPMRCITVSNADHLYLTDGFVATHNTWVGLVAVKQDLEAGEHVLIIDFEDAARGVVGRLKALGAITAETLPRLVYIRPDESFSMSAAADLGEILDSRPFGLVLVDGVNAAMQTMGFDINSNNDATAFYQRLLHPIAKRGPAVVTIDHVPKSQEARGKGGIGAQAKRGMIDGAAIRVEALHPFGRGQTGELRLTADKDRPGQVRENAVEAKYLGIFELVSDADTGQVTYTFHPPQHTSGPFRPTLIMQRISDALALLPEGASKNTIEGAVKGRAEHIRIALERLQDEGYVALSPGARKGQLVLKLVKPFDPLAMPEPEMEAIARAYYDEGEDD